MRVTPFPARCRNNLFSVERAFQPNHVNFGVCVVCEQSPIPNRGLSTTITDCNVVKNRVLWSFQFQLLYRNSVLVSS